MKTKPKPKNDYAKSVERFRQWQAVTSKRVRQFDSPRQERKFSKAKLESGGL